ncbi:hypothetical protein AVEN_193341-1 [Araneus ventricosus]|uniref:Uncharacterized protein n=1 Tax=Araneus ventricosus TaxID=182803 RepID=A0A4Y2ESC1_ARAVE|nr:hypothetical protein AVEN_193341-1 [Araneus ventricosus]
MPQIIAREDEEVTEDYEKIKALLLKRYKLTPERFRQLFMNHDKGKSTTGKIILTSAFGERTEAWLEKFLVSSKSDHKDKFYRPIEILAAVSSRIQEQLIILTVDYQLLKSSTEDGGKRKIELLQPRLVIQRTNGELTVSRNGGFGELKKEIERLREDLERLRWQRIPSKNEAVSTEKGSEDLELDVQTNKQPERCITENPLKATAYGK